MMIIAQKQSDTHNCCHQWQEFGHQVCAYHTLMNQLMNVDMRKIIMCTKRWFDPFSFLAHEVREKEYEGD
jgi:hypothetical protein